MAGLLHFAAVGGITTPVFRIGNVTQDQAADGSLTRDDESRPAPSNKRQPCQPAPGQPQKNTHRRFIDRVAGVLLPATPWMW